jgi:hypothetical protein
MFISPEYPVLSNLLVCLGMFGGMLGLGLLGRRAGLRHAAVAGIEDHGHGLVEAAILTLFGFLLALVFSAAVSRFQDRRALILEEATAMSTAYSRIDLLPEASRREVQPLFRSYVEARLMAYGNITSLETLEKDFDASERIGATLWGKVAAACRAPESAEVAEVVVPPVNEMLDVATKRRAAVRNHPPRSVYAFLILLAGVSAYLAGFPMARGKRISWAHLVAFAGATGLTLFLTLDIENPRFGLIRIDDSDRLLKAVLESMK